MELEAVATQAADLHARKQSLLAELQGVEADLTAALARSHALQSSVEEHQRVYDHKLQTLIALVPPPAPPVAAVPAAASKTTAVAGRGNHNYLSEGVRGHSSMALLQRHVTDLLGHLQTMDHPTLASTASNHHNQSRHPHQPQTSVLPSLARQVPGRVSASEVSNVIRSHTLSIYPTNTSRVSASEVRNTFIQYILVCKYVEFNSHDNQIILFYFAHPIFWY